MNSKLIKLTYKREKKFFLKNDASTNIPLSLKCNATLPKIKEVVLKQWVLLDINRNLYEIFQNPPILAFCRNNILRDIIGTKLIENGNVKREFTNKIQGKCTPWLANNRTLCYKQAVRVTTFRSNQTNRIFQIHPNLDCKSEFGTYLLESTKYKIQYVEKAETEFNIRPNNHRKDVWKTDPIPASLHFWGKNHNFNTLANINLIQQISHMDIAKENKEMLKQRENV